MGVILTVASSKGGGGKTALVCCLAPALAHKGLSIGVIDADPNESFTAWYKGYAGPAIRSAAEARDVPLVDLAQAWANELDVVIVDTAGFGNLTAAAAMGTADHVLIPCMADRGSTREAAKTMEKVASLARAARRAIGASIVLSQWRPGGVAERAALDDLADFGIRAILTTSLPDRVALRQMSFDSRAILSGPLGTTISEMIDELAKLAGLASSSKLSRSKKPAGKEVRI